MVSGAGDGREPLSWRYSCCGRFAPHRHFLFLTSFGFYYALDATFYLTYGVLSGQPPMDNLMLNGPHIAIATVLLGLVHGWVPRAGAPAGAR